MTFKVEWASLDNYSDIAEIRTLEDLQKFQEDHGGYPLIMDFSNVSLDKEKRNCVLCPLITVYDYYIE